jgi:hypothetical protein
MPTLYWVGLNVRESNNFNPHNEFTLNVEQENTVSFYTHHLNPSERISRWQGQREDHRL